MVYTFKVTEKTWIDEIIEFAVDSAGNVITERSIYGIPECLSNSSHCIFGIDSVIAVNLAKQAGLEEGVKPWQANFHWFAGTINRYVWGVTNYLTDYSGKVVIIDSNSGNIIEILNWAVIE